MYLPQIYLQCRQGPTLGSFLPERRVISVRKVRAFQAGCLIEGMILTFNSKGSPSHSEPQKEAEIHEYSNLFAQWLRENTPIRETGNWTSLPLTSERNWGEGVSTWAAGGKSFPVGG